MSSLLHVQVLECESQPHEAVASLEKKKKKKKLKLQLLAVEWFCVLLLSLLDYIIFLLCIHNIINTIRIEEYTTGNEVRIS